MLHVVVHPTVTFCEVYYVFHTMLNVKHLQTMSTIRRASPYLMLKMFYVCYLFGHVVLLCPGNAKPPFGVGLNLNLFHSGVYPEIIQRWA